MSFDPEQFGQAMGEAIKKAVAPLHARIAELEKQLASQPDISALVASTVSTAVAAIPPAASGKDGRDGADGKDCDMESVKAMIEEAVKSIGDEAAARIDLIVSNIPIPKDGRDGKDGERGEKGDRGEGIGGLLIDREGCLVVTYTDGTMENKGVVVGRDGRDGVDGKDGISLESFDMEYLPESREISVRAACAGRVKEVRFPAAGLSVGGYWREGTRAITGQAWTHGGSLYLARRDTGAVPDAKSDDWILAARRGRDGERGQRGQPGTPDEPIKLD